MNKRDKIEEILSTESGRIGTRIACLQSFEYFLSLFFFLMNDEEFSIEDFHDEINQVLQDAHSGKLKEKAILITIPVGSGKSTIVEFFIAWCFAHDPSNAFAYVSHSNDNIEKLSSEIRDIIDNPYFGLIFGRYLKTHQKAKKDWGLQESGMKGGLHARSIGSGSITGLDAGNPSVAGFNGMLIIDDPMSAGDEYYKTKRDMIKRLFNRKLKTRVRTPRTKIMLIMQRLHKDDLAAYLLKYFKGDIKHIKIPAIKEDGTSFWEKHKPIKELLRDKEQEPYTFASQYMQSPINDGGSVINVEKFQRYNPDALPQMQYRLITGDTAMKEGKKTDYSVFQCWGLGKDRNAYLIDQIRGKWKAPELIEQFQAFWNKHNDIEVYDTRLYGDLQAAHIEDAVSGTYLIQVIRNETRIPILGILRNEKKFLRVMGVTPAINSGYVFIPSSTDEHPCRWLGEFFAELEDFSDNDTHKHDDQIDPMCDGIRLLLKARPKENQLTPKEIGAIYDDDDDDDDDDDF